MAHNVRILKVNDDFFRIDVSANELGIVEGSLKGEEALPFIDHIKELALDTSARSPHLVSVYKKSEDKYFGPFVGPALPISDIPGLQQALGF